MNRIIISGKNTKLYVDFDPHEEQLMLRAVNVDVEVHNSLHPDDWWVWGYADEPGQDQNIE